MSIVLRSASASLAIALLVVGAGHAAPLASVRLGHGRLAGASDRLLTVQALPAADAAATPAAAASTTPAPTTTPAAADLLSVRLGGAPLLTVGTTPAAPAAGEGAVACTLCLSATGGVGP